MHYSINKDRLPTATIFAFLLILGAIGVASIGRRNVAPTKALFEIAVFAAATAALRIRVARVPLYVGVAAVVYVVGAFVLMRLFNNSNTFDFIQQYKCIIYLPLLCLSVGSSRLDEKLFKKVYAILLGMMVIKYAYSKLLFGGIYDGMRPGLYGENNYELMFMLLVYPLFDAVTKHRRRNFAILVATVLLSESRSAMLSLLVLYALLFTSRIHYKSLFRLAALTAMFAVAMAISVSREHGRGYESIDRYRFMLIFFNQLRHWSIWNYLFGTFPITPLSPSACSQLTFYHKLFSYSGDGQCYSVILTSFDMRSIFNFGILGTVALLWAVWLLLGCAGWAKRYKLCFVAIILVNGLSVSSLNSVYCAMALMIVLSVKRSTLRSAECAAAPREPQTLVSGDETPG